MGAEYRAHAAHSGVLHCSAPPTRQVWGQNTEHKPLNTCAGHYLCQRAKDTYKLPSTSGDTYVHTVHTYICTYIQTAINFRRHIHTHCTYIHLYIHLWQRAKKQQITTHSAHSDLLPCSTDMPPSRLPRAEYRVLTNKCTCKAGAQPVLTYSSYSKEHAKLNCCIELPHTPTP